MNAVNWAIYRGICIKDGNLKIGVLDPIVPYIMTHSVDKMIHHIVYPETVGQWSGLLDSNYNEIYHGDILCENLTGIKFEVTVDPINGSMAKNLTSMEVVPLVTLFPQKYMTVINNIYEKIPF